MAFVPWIAIAVVFYFLLIRPQKKQAKERQTMLDSLKRGDQILTQGGLYGTVAALRGGVLEIKVSDEVKVKIDRSAVSRIVKDPATEPAPSASSASS